MRVWVSQKPTFVYKSKECKVSLLYQRKTSLLLAYIKIYLYKFISLYLYKSSFCASNSQLAFCFVLSPRLSLITQHRRSTVTLHGLLCLFSFHPSCSVDLVFVSPWLFHYVQVCLVNYPHFPSHISCIHFSVSLSVLVYVSCVREPCLLGMDYPYVDY